MGWLAEALTTSGFGAITGLIGGIATKYIERKEKANERGYLLKSKELDIESLKLEHAHQVAIADKEIERAELEGEIKIEHAEIGAFTESQKTLGTLQGALRWVRPVITGYLLLFSTLLTVIVWDHVDGIEHFSPEELKDLLTKIVDYVLFLTVTAIAWWFGSRGGNIK